MQNQEKNYSMRNATHMLYEGRGRMCLVPPPLLWTESVSVYHESPESVLKNWLSSPLKFDELAIKKRSVSDQDQPTPISYF